MFRTTKLTVQSLLGTSNLIGKSLTQVYPEVLQFSVACTKLFSLQHYTLKIGYSSFRHKHAIQSKDIFKDVDLSKFNENSLVSKEKRAVITSLLGCSNETFESIIHRYPRVITVSPVLLKEKLDTYHSYNLPIEILHENPRGLFETSNKELKERLDKFKESGLLDDLLGPQNVVFQSCFGFYLECTKEHFEKSLKYLCSNLSALEGRSNLSEYLQSRLECTEEDAQKICNRQIIKRGISLARIKEVLDYALIDAGFSKKDTRKNLNLLLNSSSKKLYCRLSFYEENLRQGDQNKALSLINLLKLSERKFQTVYIDQFK